MLARSGFSVLMMDLRDAGDSDVEDGRVAWGTEEYLDVLGAWDWLKFGEGHPGAADRAARQIARRVDGNHRHGR